MVGGRVGEAPGVTGRWEKRGAMAGRRWDRSSRRARGGSAASSGREVRFLTDPPGQRPLEHAKNRFGTFHIWSVGNAPPRENEASTGALPRLRHTSA
jgi:hypothetical protein